MVGDETAGDGRREWPTCMNHWPSLKSLVPADHTGPHLTWTEAADGEERMLADAKD